jgi:dihydroorotate dehydrogenase (NAD+) catalytic subunit
LILESISLLMDRQRNPDHKFSQKGLFWFHPNSRTACCSIPKTTMNFLDSDAAPFSKRDLTFRTPLMNAAGTLGFAPDARAAVKWEGFGAFVTNPLSLHPRQPAQNPELIQYPGGFILHSGLPNPGLSAALKRYARHWADTDLPVIVNLMADRPEETARMVRMLEGLENVAAVELGFAPLLAADIIRMAVEMSLGELPLIVNLPLDQVLTLGPRVIQVGAAAISLAAPRGAMLKGDAIITGRLFGPSLFPQSLDVVLSAVKLGLPVIGGCGVYSQENASAMLAAGALAVQVDTVLWKNGWM